MLVLPTQAIARVAGIACARVLVLARHMVARGILGAVVFRCRAAVLRLALEAAVAARLRADAGDGNASDVGLATLRSHQKCARDVHGRAIRAAALTLKQARTR